MVPETRHRPIAHLTHAITAMLAISLIALSACTDKSSDASSSGGRNRSDGTYSATITRTTDGVAHIVADDLTNLAFGQGYASGEDHTCDLAEEVLKVNSTRARWFGPGDDDENIDSDFGWLALGVRDRAEADYPNVSEDARAAVAGFVAGWNRHLSDVGIDGVEGWCAGEPWVQPITEEDLYAYSRSILLLASGAQLVNYLGDAQPPAVQQVEQDQALGSEGIAEPVRRDQIGSNGWAIGAERSDSGGGMLLANPHFPWEGPLRFWEVGLEIPGQWRAYGAQLTGLPGIGIGFNDAVAWTHTVSAGKRFTAYTLDLVPGDPTSYLYDGEPRQMSSQDKTIYVEQPDGTTSPMTRTLWSSHYGPVLDFPGVGWSEQRTVTYRDANIDNTTFLDQYRGMDRAGSMSEFQQVHESYSGVPLFNTIATSAQGETWYADTSPTPNLRPDALEAYEGSKSKNLLVAAAASKGVVLLDGSDSRFEWVDEPGARSPGLVPFSKMPMTSREDYVFNANDSFWLSNADHPLSGDFSPLHGTQATPVSPRTHENATILRDTSSEGPSGTDGLFSLDELGAAALFNEGWTARQLRGEVVERCREAGPVQLDALVGSDGSELAPAATVDIGDACDVLSRWDGRYELDSSGAAIWREFMYTFPADSMNDAGRLFRDRFDPQRPVDTPSGLAEASDRDYVATGLARVVQIFGEAGIALDATLGDLQFADRDGTRVALHGGDNRDGVTNIVTWANPSFPTAEPLPPRLPSLTKDSPLTSSGYPINAGSSFIMIIQYTNDGPVARSLLAYGQSGDRSSPMFRSATERFAEKDWKPVLFTQDQVGSDPDAVRKVVTG